MKIIGILCLQRNLSFFLEMPSSEIVPLTRGFEKNSPRDNFRKLWRKLTIRKNKIQNLM
uniref:Uncharacterized protein n=1 Tax=Meloidogyne enterolobii TaxID=390850 RepID=A0A6V7UU63_MELEN|nr:unnamed protein product [Meloidogyne enterolobii]